MRFVLGAACVLGVLWGCNSSITIVEGRPNSPEDNAITLNDRGPFGVIDWSGNPLIASTGHVLAIAGWRVVRFDSRGAQMDREPIDALVGGIEGMIAVRDGFLIWNERYARLIPAAGEPTASAFIHAPGRPVSVPIQVHPKGYVWALERANPSEIAVAGVGSDAVVLPRGEVLVSSTHRVSVVESPTEVAITWAGLGATTDQPTRHTSIAPRSPRDPDSYASFKLLDQMIEGDQLHVLIAETVLAQGEETGDRRYARDLHWYLLDLRTGVVALPQSYRAQAASPLVRGQFLRLGGDLYASASGEEVSGTPLETPPFLKRTRDGVHSVMRSEVQAEYARTRLVPLGDGAAYVTERAPPDGKSGKVVRVAIAAEGFQQRDQTAYLVEAFRYEVFPALTCDFAGDRCTYVSTRHPLRDPPTILRIDTRSSTYSRVGVAGPVGFVGPIEDGSLVFGGYASFAWSFAHLASAGQRVEQDVHSGDYDARDERTLRGVVGSSGTIASASAGPCTFWGARRQVGAEALVLARCGATLSTIAVPSPPFPAGTDVVALGAFERSAFVIARRYDLSNSEIDPVEIASIDPNASSLTMRPIEGLEPGSRSQRLAVNDTHLALLSSPFVSGEFGLYLARTEAPERFTRVELERVTNAADSYSWTLTGYRGGFLLTYTNEYYGLGVQRSEHWATTITSQGVVTSRALELPAGASLRTHWTDGQRLFVVYVLPDGRMQFREIVSLPK